MAVKVIEAILWSYWTICAALIAMPVVVFVVGITIAGLLDSFLDWIDKRFYGHRDDDQAG